MHLPDYEHVIFESSPLEEVVCQFRFNDVLAIASQNPIEFQERIRRSFPVFGRQQGLRIGVANSQPIVAAEQVAWQFKTTDEAWTASLTANFIGLKTTAYRDFRDFMQRLTPVLHAFTEVYAPPFYTRVGLRYVNRFYLGREDGKPIRWDRFFNQYVASEFSSDVLQDALSETNHHVVLQTQEGSIGWRCSRDVGRTEDAAPAERFTLDFDHYVLGQIEHSAVDNLLAGFNDRIYRLFRWCLTEEGLAELGPHRKSGGQT